MSLSDVPDNLFLHLIMTSWVIQKCIFYNDSLLCNSVLLLTQQIIVPRQCNFYERQTLKRKRKNRIFQGNLLYKLIYKLRISLTSGVECTNLTELTKESVVTSDKRLNWRWKFKWTKWVRATTNGKVF